MKTRKLLSILLSTALIVSLTAGCGTAQKSAPASEAGKAANTPITIKLSHSAPATSLTGRAYAYYGKTLEEESKGNIKVEVAPAGALVSDPDLLDAVQKGNIDMGHMMVSYVTPTIKELTPFEVPGAYPGNKFKEFAKAIRPTVDKIMSKYGVKYIAAIGQDTMVFVGKKKLAKSPADLKGSKVRTAGKWGGEAIKTWGGAPVTIAIGDLPTALERGTVDYAHTSWIATGNFKLYETAPNIAMTDMQEMFVSLIMSDKTWKKLNPEQQAAVMRAGEKFEAYSYDLMLQEKEKFLKTVKDAKCTVYDLTAADNASFKAGTQTLLEQVKPISGPEGQELINIFANLSK